MDTHSIFRKDVAVNAILYIINKLGGVLDLHKINKLLYFADQKHLSKYGRTIIGDTYMAMQYGPVPSKVTDIFKALRGDSYFSDKAGEFYAYFQMVNQYVVKAKIVADTDYLSVSETKCLDEAIAKYGGLNFNDITSLSHGLAWSNAPKDRAISYEDVLREAGETEAYIDYVAENLAIDKKLSAYEFAQ